MPPASLHRLVGYGEIAPDPRWHMLPHRHPGHHELIVILEGRMSLHVDGAAHAVGGGDVLCYRQGLVHEEISDPRHPVHLYFIAFTGPLPPLPLRTPDAGGRVRQWVTWLLQDLRHRRPAAACQSLLAALVSELDWLRVAPREPWLDGLIDWMRANLARDLSLSDIARRARMSRFTFIRKFKRLSGKTPMSELRQLRLSAARNLLLGSNLPLKAIAPRVGLGDEYQCAKLFRRYFGLSSRQIRAFHGAGH
ncbi:MAG: AraC family transcriptional regulator [Opitutaceae bacterium]|jgi:AraC-like DNA-binding protein|nr:AraC family transcriptional regulator [Opitutaceae bacterium]